MDKELAEKLIKFMETAVSLADNITADSMHNGRVSIETKIILDQFNKKTRDVSDLLDALNGVN